jgi:hypothetical protein
MYKPPRYALGLDLGSTLGWAKCIDGVIVDSGVVDLRVGDKDDPRYPGRRFEKFWNWILENHHEADEVYYERVVGFQHSTMAMGAYFGLLAMLQLFCEVYGKKAPTGIHTTTLKHRFTTNGRAKKIEMCNMAINLGWKNGHSGTDLNHDEADAIALVVVKQLEIYDHRVTFQQ